MLGYGIALLNTDDNKHVMHGVCVLTHYYSFSLAIVILWKKCLIVANKNWSTEDTVNYKLVIDWSLRCLQVYVFHGLHLLGSILSTTIYSVYISLSDDCSVVFTCLAYLRAAHTLLLCLINPLQYKSALIPHTNIIAMTFPKKSTYRRIGLSGAHRYLAHIAY